MDDEKLISLVQERSELYDKNNPLFKFVDKKAEAWMDIGNEMEVAADECMRRWGCLRDRFTRETRKADNPNSDIGSVWPYLDMMKFLKPFVAPRPFRTSGFLRRNRLFKSAILPKRTPPPLPSPTHSALASPASPESPHLDCQEFSQITEDPLTEIPSVHKKTFSSNPEVDKSFCEAVEALKRACALNETKYKNPAVYAFGEMIVSTICSMNSRNQLKAMQLVTDTVMKIKLEEDEVLEQIRYSGG